MVNEFENRLIALGVLRARGTAADGTPLYADLGEEPTFYDMSKQTRTLSAMTGRNLKLFAEEMDTAIRNMHHAVKALIVRKALTITDAMRLANSESKSGYGGAVGGGASLYFTISWAYDFIDPDVVSDGTAVYPSSGHDIADDNRRNWIRVIETVSARDSPTPFITGVVTTVGSAVDLSVAEEESMVFLGMTDKAGVDHIASAMQVVYNSDTQNYWAMNFDMLEQKDEQILVWEMPQHAIVPPEQSIQLNVRYDKRGTSYLAPIVVRFLRSKDMRTL